MNAYDKTDCGCYVDGARGIYGTDAIVDIARDHGAVIAHDCANGDHAETFDESEFAGCEFASEYQQEAEDYMNEHHCPDGCYWGTSEAGDWGLWEIED